MKIRYSTFTRNIVNTFDLGGNILKGGISKPLTRCVVNTSLDLLFYIFL